MPTVTPVTLTPPHAGGTLTVAYPSEPATLDPFANGGEGPPTRDLVSLLSAGLWRTDGDVLLELLLAREPVVDEGPPFTVRFELRSGMRWSDGAPIGAEDLRYTWETARGTVAGDGYQHVTDVIVETPSIARVAFREPFAPWRDLFGIVLPAHLLRGRDRHALLHRAWPASSGPFTLERWTRGLEMVFARNPRAPAGAASLDTLRVVFVPDSTTALELVRRGEVDAIAGYHAPDLSRRARRAGLRVTSAAGGSTLSLVLNARSRTLDAARVRRAISLALDPARIASALYREEGEPHATLLAGPRGVGESFDADGDLARAKELLEAAGWRGSGVRRREGRPLSITVAVATSDDLAGLALRAARVQAMRAGIELVPVFLDADTFWGTWLHGRRLEGALVEWRDAPGGSLSARFGGGPADVCRVTDEKLRASLARADRVQSHVALADVQRRLALSVPAVPLASVRVSVVSRDAVIGRLCAGAAGPFCAAGEWQRS